MLTDPELQGEFGVRWPEHRACNRATLTHAKQKASFMGVERWSRHWYGPYNERCPDCRALGGPCSKARADA